jgi:hypothetical protein
MLLQTLRAIAYAHSAGVLHLRLEPACIQLKNAHCDVQVSGIGRTRTGNKKTTTADKRSPLAPATAAQRSTSSSGNDGVAELVLTSGTRSVILMCSKTMDVEIQYCIVLIACLHQHVVIVAYMLLHLCPGYAFTTNHQSAV